MRSGGIFSFRNLFIFVLVLISLFIWKDIKKKKSVYEVKDQKSVPKNSTSKSKVTVNKIVKFPVCKTPFEKELCQKVEGSTGLFGVYVDQNVINAFVPARKYVIQAQAAGKDLTGKDVWYLASLFFLKSGIAELDPEKIKDKKFLFRFYGENTSDDNIQASFVMKTELLLQLKAQLKDVEITPDNHMTFIRDAKTKYKLIYHSKD